MSVTGLGRVTLYIGLILTVVGLLLGFGFMFQDRDELAKLFLMVVPFGFLLLFAGLSTIILFAPPKGDDK